MSVECTISFEMGSHQDTWAKIFSLMDRGVVGARLQDEFDIFGQDAADQLEQLLDEYPSFLLMGQGHQIKGKKIYADFEWSRGDEPFARDFIKLLRICGAKRIKVHTFDLSGD